jgi:hypothetical protein
MRLAKRGGHTVTELAARERAALDILNRLPDGWHVGPATYDPGSRRWSVTARGPHPGRGKHPETIRGTGEDELAAMAYLAIALEELRRDERLEEIDRRGRLSFLEGAEEQSREATGRPLSAEELNRVTRRHPTG